MKRFIVFIQAVVMVFLATSCHMTGKEPGQTAGNDTTKFPSIMKTHFGTVDHKEVLLFTLKNSNGIVVRITNYGGIVTSILAPGNKGRMADIVLGYDSLKDYIANSPYFGAIVGRYANRIAKGTFRLDGKKYTLAVNNGNNALHGGLKGFDKVVWDAREFSDSVSAGLELSYLSKDGEEGYPGNLKVLATYILNNDNELRFTVEATTDKATPVNIANHTYFNLTGGETDILGHDLQLMASRYTEVNDELIPTGRLPEVKGTAMEFGSNSGPIGSRIAQVKGGYDHNYVLNKQPGAMSDAATLIDPASRRAVGIRTTQPGIQFYSGNFLDGTITGKGGIVYKKHWGLCLETQHFPDSPNQATFPNTILKPGETFREETVYTFYSLIEK